MANASRNGTGTFTRVYDWTDDAANSIAITASRFDEEMDGVAAELTNSLAADGQTTMTGNIKMGSNKITGLADATLVTDAPSAGQVADNDFGYLGTTAGTSAAYTLTPSPAIAALVTGQEHSFTTNADNTGTTTLAISGLTAKNLKVLDAGGAKQAVSAGGMKNGISYKVRYDGTDYLLIDQVTAAAASTATTSAEGVVELATNAEVTTGSDSSRVSPVSSMVYHQGVAKAWGQYDGTGTPAFADSYNFSSITDTTTGKPTLNFSTAMSNANYSAVANGTVSAAPQRVGVIAYATGSVQVGSLSGAGAYADADAISVIVMGDR